MWTHLYSNILNKEHSCNVCGASSDATFEWVAPDLGIKMLLCPQCHFAKLKRITELFTDQG